MKWFTCTPVAFGGGEDFFARDSGLLSRGFRAIGIESRAVMPGERKPEDLDELIRTDFANLESPTWWRSHDLDGVVLYAWGRPRFRRVARAIREAGIPLVLNQDNGGLVSPVCGLREWWREQLTISGAGRVPGGWARAFQRIARGMTVGLLVSDRLRAAHLAEGDRIACVSPRAAELHRRFCLLYGGEALASKVTCVPHAVDPRFTWDGGVKERRVIAIGRWDDVRQKRPELLMKVVGRLLEADPAARIDVVGRVPEAMGLWHGKLPDPGRVTLHGRIEPELIVCLLRRAQVAWCPSAFESFHIASAEALCCGCSVVGARSPSLAALQWFTGEGDGRLTDQDDAAGHVAAIRAELDVWTKGTRKPGEIGSRWASRLHAPKLAERVVGLFD